MSKLILKTTIFIIGITLIGAALNAHNVAAAFIILLIMIFLVPGKGSSSGGGCSSACASDGGCSGDSGCSGGGCGGD